MNLDWAALREVFLAESDERLERFEESLLTLERDGADREAAAEVFRTLHSLKGDAAAVGFRQLAAFAHRAEDVLAVVKKVTGEA